MIPQTKRTTFRLLAPLLLLQLLAVGVVIPLLDTDLVAASVTIDSPHEGCDCPVSHDHRICTQVATNHALGTAPEGAPDQMLRLSTLPAFAPAHPPILVCLSAARPRAPPRV